MSTGQFKAAIKPEDLKLLHDLLHDCEKSEVMAYRALNYGAKQGRKLAVDYVYAKLNVKKGLIREETKLSRFASAHDLAAKLTIYGNPFGIELFGANQTRKGVTFKIWRDSTRERYRHAFFASLFGGAQRVYERDITDAEYDGRFPLRRKLGPGVATVFNETPWLAKRAIQEAGDATIREAHRLAQLMIEGKL